MFKKIFVCLYLFPFYNKCNCCVSTYPEPCVTLSKYVCAPKPPRLHVHSIKIAAQKYNSRVL